MIPVYETVEGRFGRATPIHQAPPGDTRPDGAIRPVWLLDCPGQHPFWSQFMLQAVHLHDRPGLPAPKLQRPGVTHEIAQFALNPDHGPYTARSTEFRSNRQLWRSVIHQTLAHSRGEHQHPHPPDGGS